MELNHVIAAGAATQAGTYLDAGRDVSGLTLAATVDLPAVVARVTGSVNRRIDVGALAALGVEGSAVLVQTRGDAGAGTPTDADDRYIRTPDGAEWLATHGAALVGIDAPCVSAAGIPVVANLTGLDRLPPTGARFTAVPLRVDGVRTIPVRAFARVPA